MAQVRVMITKPFDTQSQLRSHVSEIIDLAREMASKRKVRMPKAISFGGSSEPVVWICYSANRVRNVLMDACDEIGYEYDTPKKEGTSKWDYYNLSCS